ncbi:Gfo/Idh/MocA family protein [Pseudactinotalea sp. Z1739]|uniref:Gfo/Idh/MocA family protein n=1 Tax=Pseudactinotalea sp. Z1739 TaxID=3413028 RepID=UPI003C7E4D6E
MSTGSDHLTIGVIGLGIIGRQHVERFTAADTPVRLAGVYDTNEALVQQFARTHDVPGVSSVEELLALEDMDAVVIAVPSGLHRDLTITALQAGKHVLLEKPIDISVAASDEILQAARASGTVLSVVSQRRFAPANQYIKQLIDDGGLGRITSAAIEVPLWRTQEYYDSAGWRGTWAMDGGGALMNQGVHLVDLALWLLGDVEEVYAHTGLLAHERIEVEDTVTITARLKSGAFMTFLATTAAHSPPQIRVNIMGDRGSIVTVKEEITHYETVDGAQKPDLEVLPLEESELSETEHLQHRQLLDFVQAVRNDATALVTPEQARNAVAFIEAVYESGRTGQPVRPAPLPE